MAYVDVGEGDPIVFLHAIPTPRICGETSSPTCCPSDGASRLITSGMGNSGPPPMPPIDLWIISGVSTRGSTRWVSRATSSWSCTIGGRCWGSRGPSAIPSGSKHSSTWRASSGRFFPGRSGPDNTGILQGTADTRRRGSHSAEEPLRRIPAASSRDIERDDRCVPAPLSEPGARAQTDA